MMIPDKLLGLLRRRPSIRGRGTALSLAPSVDTDGGDTGDKAADGGKLGSAADTTKPRDMSPAPKVTFRDNKSGETRTVALHVRISPQGP